MTLIYKELIFDAYYSKQGREVSKQKRWKAKGYVGAVSGTREIDWRRRPSRAAHPVWTAITSYLIIIISRTPATYTLLTANISWTIAIIFFLNCFKLFRGNNGTTCQIFGRLSLFICWSKDTITVNIPSYFILIMLITFF